ncbi:DUF6292 family protein [Streptomyces sporangiiformans]|uniref:Uncharacterized protein n=1 Tax=Streptomyces sporangiiformans TaxID=2315329 RepID=A0A505D502_9ACTN|nr:DUF6292 family protein [Streptomyces sporangiiformans]TPQ17610.1 hypothetical protein FGD71_035485 [Streptomyces sporangiiformans]
MLLDPPGLLRPELLPHWPYARAVDQALNQRGIPPGTVRAGHTGREHGQTMYLALTWDVSRCAGPGGIRLTWQDDTGWAYTFLGPGHARPRKPLAALHRTFADPNDIADVADHLVLSRRLLSGERVREWSEASTVRAAIDAFRRWPTG